MREIRLKSGQRLTPAALERTSALPREIIEILCTGSACSSK